MELLPQLLKMMDVKTMTGSEGQRKLTLGNATILAYCLRWAGFRVSPCLAWTNGYLFRQKVVCCSYQAYPAHVRRIWILQSRPAQLAWAAFASWNLH